MATATRSEMGALADGRIVEQVVLTAGDVSATVMTLGAGLQALRLPDRDGAHDDVLLGYDTPAEYLADPQYFGVTVGRYANRIARGRFTLDGREYRLDCNNGPNHLHGGPDGFDKRLWTIAEVSEGEGSASVTLTLHSPDGDAGYPGALDVTVRYTLTRDALEIDLRAVTDAPTIVSLTNHALFHLGGTRAADGVLGHRMQIHAERFTPVDEVLIPTGDLAPVAGTPFDFRTPVPLGARVRDSFDPQIERGRGYDHNFVHDGEPGTLRPAARVEDPVSGRVLTLATTAPGLQLYTGNWYDGTSRGKSGRLYRQGDGFALEAQHFPDAPNQPNFPSPRLDPGEEYANRIVLGFSVTR